MIETIYQQTDGTKLYLLRDYSINISNISVSSSIVDKAGLTNRLLTNFFISADNLFISDVPVITLDTVKMTISNTCFLLDPLKRIIFNVLSNSLDSLIVDGVECDEKYYMEEGNLFVKDKYGENKSLFHIEQTVPGFIAVNDIDIESIEGPTKIKRAIVTDSIYDNSFRTIASPYLLAIVVLTLYRDYLNYISTNRNIHLKMPEELFDSFIINRKKIETNISNSKDVRKEILQKTFLKSLILYYLVKRELNYYNIDTSNWEVLLNGRSL